MTQVNNMLNLLMSTLLKTIIMFQYNIKFI